MNSCNIQHSNTLSSELDHITAIDQISSFSTPLKPICTTGLLFEFSDERLADDAVAATDTNRATSRNRADKPVKQTAAKPSKQLEKHPCQTKSQCGKSIYIYVYIHLLCVFARFHSQCQKSWWNPSSPPSSKNTSIGLSMSTTGKWYETWRRVYWKRRPPPHQWSCMSLGSLYHTKAHVLLVLLVCSALDCKRCHKTWTFQTAIMGPNPTVLGTLSHNESMALRCFKLCSQSQL